jgi:hypothetical protein
MSRNRPGRDREPVDALGSLGDLLETIREAAEAGALPDPTTAGLDRAIGAGPPREPPARPEQPRPETESGEPEPTARVDRPTHIVADCANRLVTVDLGDTGVDTASDLDAAVEGGALAVVADGATVARVPLPEGEWAVGTITLNNGVFAARLGPD